MRGPSTTKQVFTERLLPGPWVWCAATLAGGVTGLLALPFGPWWSLGAAIVTWSAIAVALVHSTPTIAVDEELRAGDAHIPVRFLANARVIPAHHRSAALGRELDARAYLCIRPWIPSSVAVDVVDHADSTPYWIISTRHPENLVAAIDQAAHSEQTG